MNKKEFMNKKAISNLVAYILLISIVITMASVTYSVIKTYVPHNSLECPSDLSIFVKDYQCSTTELSLVLKNSGKFSIGGYLVYVTNNPEAGLATLDISSMITSGETPMMPTGIKLSGEGNSFDPNEEETHVFDISSISPRVYSIEIVPMRWQEEGRKNMLVTCMNSKMRKSLECA